MRLPLFPLKAVLFPGGLLPLRIFEARYMDMVRACMKEEAPFGVCLIKRGPEVGRPAQTESVGCVASIIDWDMQQLGLLNIRAIGTQRFHVIGSRAQPDGLQLGDVDLIAADEDEPLAPEHAPCAELLTRIIDDLESSRGGRMDAAGDAGTRSVAAALIERPYRMDSAVWVGNRLCEVLPVPLRAKQKLMELDDAHTRLDIVMQYLRQHSVFK